MKVDLSLLSPAGVVDKLNAEGCDISLLQYKSFILAMTKIGMRRVAKRVATRLPGGQVGEAIKAVESIIDPEESVLRKLLRSSVENHLNLTHAANRWFEDPAEEIDEKDLPLER